MQLAVLCKLQQLFAGTLAAVVESLQAAAASVSSFLFLFPVRFPWQNQPLEVLCLGCYVKQTTQVLPVLLLGY